MSKKRERLLVIDGIAANYSVAQKLLQGEGRDLFFLDSADDALDMLSVEPCDLVLVHDDGNLEISDRVVRFRQEKKAGFIIIGFSGSADEKTVTGKLEHGIDTYLRSDEYDTALQTAVETHFQMRDIISQKELLEAQLSQSYSLEHPLLESNSMEKARAFIQKAIKSDKHLLICGESGTGKEIIARIIHYNSGRRDRLFSSITSTNVESEQIRKRLFGEIKTDDGGITRTTPGIFQMTNGGTLFIDEIDKFDPEIQAEIFDVIENGRLKAVGSARVEPIDIRVVFSTVQNLEKALTGKSVDQRILEKTKDNTLDIDPLRKHKQEIIPLAETFIHKSAESTGKDIQGLSSEAMEMLLNYDWPGNHRELENIIERAVMMSDFGELTRDVFSIFGEKNTELVSRFAEEDLYGMEYLEARKILMDNFAREYFERVLRDEKWNITHAADRSGVKRQSLHEIINRLKIKKS
ncbi:MAG: sigma-54-dependent Fis family transcriptional regulator [Acidobacteria bacterium]|nr:sigma-54-dependent Fis family transcriptional regulator [Acidobacteriota bacterium]